MTNNYGLDVRYFREKLALVLAGLDNYYPAELARELTRLADTADSNAMFAELDRLNPDQGYGDGSC